MPESKQALYDHLKQLALLRGLTVADLRPYLLQHGIEAEEFNLPASLQALVAKIGADEAEALLLATPHRPHLTLAVQHKTPRFPLQSGTIGILTIPNTSVVSTVRCTRTPDGYVLKHRRDAVIDGLIRRLNNYLFSHPLTLQLHDPTVHVAIDQEEAHLRLPQEIQTHAARRALELLYQLAIESLFGAGCPATAAAAR